MSEPIEEVFARSSRVRGLELAVAALEDRVAALEWRMIEAAVLVGVVLVLALIGFIVKVLFR